MPERKLPEKKILEKYVNKIIDLSSKITKAITTDNVPINMIRRITSWAHLSGDKKVVVIENADRMMEGSRNALLKILEEPPRNLYFILIAEKKGSIIPTILSRLRPYFFKKRSDPESRLVLEKIFREESGEYRNLNDFFLEWEDINCNKLRQSVIKFLDSVISFDDHGKRPGDINDLFVSLSVNFHPFLNELTDRLRNILINKDGHPEFEKIPLIKLEYWNRLIRETALQKDIYNQNPSLLIEGLFYKMKSPDLTGIRHN